jgi:hypothetical protein
VTETGETMNDGPAAEARRRAERFVERLREVYGESLRAAVLYGSAARGEYRPGISDLNLLVLLSDLAMPELRRGAELTREWAAEGNPPPLMMTEREWLGSADVFPLEYSDIRDAHVLLAGSDPFAGVRIEREHLRLQVEHELRSKKIQLREGYLVAGDSPQRLGQLLIRSLSTFLTLFRATLRLAGRPVPRAASDLVFAAASEIGFGAEPVLEVLRGRQSPEDFEASLQGSVAAGYLEAVERSVEWLDHLGRESGGSPTV